MGNNDTDLATRRRSLYLPSIWIEISRSPFPSLKMGDSLKSRSDELSVLDSHVENPTLNQIKLGFEAFNPPLTTKAIKTG